MTDQEKAVDMEWLANNEKDPHEHYVNLPRERLAGPQYTDDNLAYRAAMWNTISDDEDMRKMLDAHKTGDDYLSKSILGEVIKDRLRWLSRRVAWLEGRYPGSPMPSPALQQLLNGGGTVDPYLEAVAEARLDRQTPLLAAVCGVEPHHGIHDLDDLLKAKNIKVDAIKVGMSLGMFVNSQFGKRWQIYVGLAKELLKQGIFIPYWNDEYKVHPDGSVHISKSQFFASGQRYNTRVRVEAPSGSYQARFPGMVVDSTHKVTDSFFTLLQLGDLALVEAFAQNIYESKYSHELGYVPWVLGGNSDKQLEARADANNVILAMSPEEKASAKQARGIA